MLPAGGLGVSPSYPYSPQIGGFRELIFREVQDASCRGFGGVPQLPIIPPRLGARGLKSSYEADRRTR
jgi:hypothetical protein